MTGLEFKTGDSTITRPANVTPYAAGDALTDVNGDGFIVADVFRPTAAGAWNTGLLKYIGLRIQGVLAVGTFRIWFLRHDGILFFADNTPFTVDFATTAVYSNFVDIELVAGTDCCFGQEFPDIPIQRQDTSAGECWSQAQTLFAWVPTASQQMTLSLTVDPR